VVRAVERARKIVENVPTADGPGAVARYVALTATWPARNLLRFGLEYANDRRLGIHTRSGLLHPAIDGRENYPYVPSTMKQFSDAMQLLPVSAGEYTFVDLGSGKGFSLLLAVKAGFRRAIGVEIVPELFETASQNRAALEVSNPDLAARIELELGDVRDFDFPTDPTVAFLYNPFGEQVLRSVLIRLEQSVRAHPRPAYLVYVNPTLDTVVRSNRAYHQIGQNRTCNAYQLTATANMLEDTTTLDRPADPHFLPLSTVG
jgi:predicted RNA methylase